VNGGTGVLRSGVNGSSASNCVAIGANPFGGRDSAGQCPGAFEGSYPTDGGTNMEIRGHAPSGSWFGLARSRVPMGLTARWGAYRLAADPRPGVVEHRTGP